MATNTLKSISRNMQSTIKSIDRIAGVDLNKKYDTGISWQNEAWDEEVREIKTKVTDVYFIEHILGNKVTYYFYTSNLKKIKDVRRMMFKFLKQKVYQSNLEEYLE